jgi:hypothetical protein
MPLQTIWMQGYGEHRRCFAAHPSDLLTRIHALLIE